MRGRKGPDTKIRSTNHLIKNKVQQAVDELGLQAEVISVMDPIRIADLEAMSLPQMVIDGNIAPSSKLSSIDSIKELLRTAGKQG